VNETANVGGVFQFDGRDSHRPSFAILLHDHYLGAAAYPDWETDDLACPAQLYPPYHATNLCPACLSPHLELSTLEQVEVRYFGDSLKSA